MSKATAAVFTVLSATMAWQLPGCPPAPVQQYARRHVAPIAQAAADPAAAGLSVAEWCVSAGREEAKVAVSSATTVAGCLHDFWMVARGFAEDDGPRGRQCVIALPFWTQGVSDMKLFERMLEHISGCSDMCEYVGDSMTIAGRHPAASRNDDEPQSAPCPILLLKSYKQTSCAAREPALPERGAAAANSSKAKIPLTPLLALSLLTHLLTCCLHLFAATARSPRRTPVRIALTQTRMRICRARWPTPPLAMDGRATRRSWGARARGWRESSSR